MNLKNGRQAFSTKSFKSFESADQTEEVEEEPPGRAVHRTTPANHKRREAYVPLSTVIPITTRRKNKKASFRSRHFPLVSDRQWNDWQWQIANRIRSLSQLERMLCLTQSERSAAEALDGKLPLSITPYYMRLIAEGGEESPLRRTVVPTAAEFVESRGEADDPLGEDAQSPVPGLVHRYPDRVLLMVLDFCSTYCRYCTRSRTVGHGRFLFNKDRLEKAIAYIRENTSIRDVLLSGGDPLTLNDARLDWLLGRLREIKHVEIIRIGTKIPAVLPQRITQQLTRVLHRHHPIWMSLHFAHPDECTTEAQRACSRLADAGIPLGSQTVLLKGINDDVDTMRELMHRLMRMRVRPYYLYQCDPITGSSHFRTSVEKGLEIIRGLRGHTSGYAVPTYVIDAPGGGGKIPLMPEYIQGREGDELLLTNYQNRTFRYPDFV